MPVSQPPFPTSRPVVQAPMAGVQGSALAIAVAKAGGVGSLPCAMLAPQTLVKELETLRSAGCDCYNLNFFCHQQPPVDTQQELGWRHTLQPYFREYGLVSDDIDDKPGRQPFSESILELIRPYRPPIVSFHFGLPDHRWIDEIKSWGASVWSTATTAQEAVWLENNGADAVITQGIEAGGHRGMFLSGKLSTQLPAFELMEEVKDQLSVPVIAAGGLGNPTQLARAITSGAWAVQVGTAYLCCTECHTSRIHRARLSSEKAPTTRITNVFSGRPARGIENRLMKEVGPLSDVVPNFPYAATALAPLRAAAEARGLGDFSPLWSGTDTSGCREVGAREHTEWLTGRL
ncbi:MAG: nitronate monooxygenase [Pseudomonadota bacterium]